MREIDGAASCRELLRIALKHDNRARFGDGRGHPLPFVKELADYVAKKRGELEGKYARNAPLVAAAVKKFKEQKAKEAQRQARADAAGEKPPKQKLAVSSEGATIRKL